MLVLTSMGTTQSERIDSLYQIISELGDSKEKVDAMHQLTYELWTYNYESPYSLILEYKALAEQLNYNKGIALANTNLGIYNSIKGNYSEAMDRFRLGVQGLKSDSDHENLSYALSRIGNLHRMQGNYDSSFYYYQLADSTNQEKKNESTASILYNRGLTFLKLEVYDSAYRNLMRSLEIRKQQSDSLLLAETQKEIAKLFIKTRDYDSAEYYLEKVRRIAEKHAVHGLKIFYSIYMGELLFHQGKYGASIENIKESLSLLNEQNFARLRVISLYTLGKIYSEIGEYDGAIDNLTKAYSINKELVDEKLQGEISFELAYVYYSQYIFEKAEESAAYSLAIFSKLGHERSWASTMNLLGLIELEKKNYEKSLYNFDEGLKIYQRLSDKKGIASVLYNKSYVFLNQGKIEEVLDIQLEAMEMEKEINNTLGLIISYNALGSLYIELNNFKEAEKYLLLARQLLQEAPSLSNLEENNRILAELYSRLGSYRKAFNFMKMAKQNSDSLFSQNSLAKSIQLSAIHDLEKKELEIETLNKEQKAKDLELSLKEIQLRQQTLTIYIGAFAILFFTILSYILFQTIRKLKKTQQELIRAEKRASLGILTAGLGHEINNPLNFIVGGLDGLSRSNENWDEDQKKFISAINEGVTRTTKILQLLNQYKEKNSEEFTVIDLVKTLKRCASENAEQYQNKSHISLEHHPKHAFILGNEDDMRQLLKALLDNAIEAMDDTGRVKVSIKKSIAEVKIIIEDNGRGIPKQQLSQVDNPFFTTKGPDQGKGMGLYLADYIVNHHGGKMEISSSPNKGTTVTISLPLHQVK